MFGGLGNQLFQYCFGKYLANILETSVKYDVQTEILLRNFTPRELELNAFCLPIIIASKEEIGKMKYFSNGLLEKVERRLTKRFPTLRSTYFVESHLHGIIQTENIKDNCYYEGYWQSYYYPMTDKFLINNIDLSNIKVDSEQCNIVSEINNTNSISIHIRRGDYISIKVNTKIFHTCDLEYYYNAIAFFNLKFKNPRYFVFTDDVIWATNNLLAENLTFVSGNQPSIDMYLMSLCKHNIIANSTFSWWGAWFNSNDDKIIIAPKQWYVGKQNENLKCLILDKWIQM
ncbi:MAG: alpha-1,2-fucosyltransferase [Patescibacteria group bacterium]